jgi:hypothetical protein
MTFRVQRSTVDDALVLMLSGDIAGDHTADLETLLVNAGEGPIVLDLKRRLKTRASRSSFGRGDPRRLHVELSWSSPVSIREAGTTLGWLRHWRRWVTPRMP